MLLAEVNNNNKMDSFCEYCMKRTKYELRSLFEYLDSDGNGEVTAEGMFHAFKHFKNPFPVTPSMLNHFILLNDASGKAALNKEEFT